jgi:serine protease Do
LCGGETNAVLFRIDLVVYRALKFLILSYEELRLKSKFYLVFSGLLLALLLVTGCSENQTPGPKQDNVAQTAPQPDPAVPSNEPIARISSQVEPSVVQVNVSNIQTTPFGEQEQQGGLGSGVIYRSDGYIITNNHVVEGAEQVNVALADGSTIQGEVIGGDTRTDIAVVRTERGDLPAASFQTGRAPTVGQLAVAIGSPSGFESTVTAGVISGLNREISPQVAGSGQQIPSLVDLIQTDAAISPGNSGGALVNRSAEVVGINVAYLPQTQSGQPVAGLGFAIPADTAISVADQLIETGEVSTAYLGIGLADLSPQDAEQFGVPVNSGAIVTNVEPGSAADAAGIRTEDIITAIDGTQIEDSGDLLAALRDYQSGDTAQVSVVHRNGNEETLNVTLDERPQQ